MSEDIVKRLRFMGRHGAETERCAAIRRVNERNEAADLIEALRAPLPAEQPSNLVALTDKQKANIGHAALILKREGHAQLADSLQGILARIVGQQAKGGGNA